MNVINTIKSEVSEVVSNPKFRKGLSIAAGGFNKYRRAVLTASTGALISAVTLRVTKKPKAAFVMGTAAEFGTCILWSEMDRKQENARLEHFVESCVEATRDATAGTSVPVSPSEE